jgi:hypothetical protein
MKTIFFLRTLILNLFAALTRMRALTHSETSLLEYFAIISVMKMFVPLQKFVAAT